MTDFRGANAQFEEYAARLADKNKRIADLEVSMRHAAKIEDALRGIVNHWYEFGEMMIENRTDYGLDERIEAASKLVRERERVMATCAHCGGEITNKFLKDCCMPCLERAMEALTPEHIGAAMRDIVERSEDEGLAAGTHYLDAAGVLQMKPTT